LKITGEHRDGFRDHVIFSLALGTALREHEICALNVGDVRHEDGRVRRRFQLWVFKRSSKNPADQVAFLPDKAVYKLAKFFDWKRASGESLEPDAPLFISRRGTRLSTRTVRYLNREWQTRAGFDQIFSFHKLRHAALTKIQRDGGDLTLTQRVARHKNPATTAIYAAPSDEDIINAVRALPC
jgi:site-specific recombinase XerD